MKIRHLSLIIALISALATFADKKMTVRNTETGESYEVSVPDGFKIYEYDSNRLDSIPYLLERARYGEPWAYMALGDCYRYGNGGVDRSIFKAFVFYSLSGLDVDKKAEELAEENPHDIMGLIYKLLERIAYNDKEEALCVLDTLHRHGYDDAEVLRDFLKDVDKEKLATKVEQNLRNPEVGTDKIMFTFLGCSSMNWLPDFLEDNKNILMAIADKLPYLYGKVGVKFFNESHEDMDSVKLAEKKATVIGLLEKADKEAMLTGEGASILYNYYMSEIEVDRMVFDEKEMERLAILAKLPECETFIFTDK